LYIVLKRIVIDVLKWIVVFLIFAVAFQIAFMSITQQVDPDISVWTSTVSNGTFMGAYMTIIGDWATTMAVIEPSWFGVVLVSLYALIAQILLVNLLIAMMGDTFNNVRQNIKQEWPFWRYNTILVYKFSSANPPPLNIIVVPLVFLYRKFFEGEIYKKIKNTPVADKHVKEKKMQETNPRNCVKIAQEQFLKDLAAEAQKSLPAVQHNILKVAEDINTDNRVQFSEISKRVEEINAKIENLNNVHTKLNSFNDKIEETLNNNMAAMTKILERLAPKEAPISTPRAPTPASSPSRSVPLTEQDEDDYSMALFGVHKNT